MFNTIKNRLKLYLYAPHFRWIGRIHGTNQFTLLDVGCNAHSVSLYKSFFSNVIYEGIDYHNPLITKEVVEKMDKFHEFNLTQDLTGFLDGNKYDCIVLSHVIEHLPNSLDLLRHFVSLLNKNGCIMVEYPGENSQKLKSTKDRRFVKGTSNFYDDQTHVALYKRLDISKLFTDLGLVILKSEIRRNWYFIALSPIVLLYRFARGKGKLNGSDLWDFTGFAEVVYAKKVK